jgi:photosystem II stability/assembly factor-like uncharacterized protein
MPGSDRHSRARTTGSLAVVLVSAAFLAAHTAGAVVIRDNLFGVRAMSPSEAWVVGNFGSIYHTDDGGKSWEARESGTEVPLFGVDFADAEHGWVVGKASATLATTDGGRTWKKQKSAIPADKHLFSVDAIDARTAWAVGDWGAIQVTRDGGATWEDRSLDEDVILYDLSFPDPQHGFIVGEFGLVLSTTDGGQTWQQQKLEIGKTLFGVGFATADTGWAVGIDGLIIRTRDGGKTWDVQRGRAGLGDLEELGFLDSLKNPGLYDVAVQGRYGVVIGDTGMVLTTADGGDTWTQHPLPENQRLVWVRGLSLVPGTHGFLVGANGFAAKIEHDKLVLPEPAAPPAAAP